MKLLFENWREYLEKNGTPKRVVLNELVEVSEQQLKDFPLSQEELAKLSKWGELKGRPVFLGSGTMGKAYQFDKDVLKITKDYAEATAAKSIAGKVHPNVYKIKKVGRRYAQGEDPPPGLSDHPFVIVYEMVGDEAGGSDIPTKEQQEVIKVMHGRPKKIYYNWNANLGEAMNKFGRWIMANPAAAERNQMTRFQNHEQKLLELLEAAGLDELEREVLRSAWAISVGLYSAANINSSDGIINALSSPNFKYVDDIASGLTFLEQNGIHFKDLKTTNVMNEKGRLVIIDIGKSDVRNKEPIAKIEF